MKNYKTYTATLLLLTVSAIAICQTASPTIITTAGGHSQSPPYSLSWTIGDINTGTLENDGYILTQGFLQGEHVVQVFEKTETTGIDIDIYPNPVNNILNIRIRSLQNSNEYYFEITDISGKIFAKDLINNEYQFNTNQLENASYFIRITTQKGQLIKTYKIIKY